MKKQKDQISRRSAPLDWGFKIGLMPSFYLRMHFESCRSKRIKWRYLWNASYFAAVETSMSWRKFRNLRGLWWDSTAPQKEFYSFEYVGCNSKSQSGTGSDLKKKVKKIRHEEFVAFVSSNANSLDFSILGNYMSVFSEPLHTSTSYTRRTLSGEFIIVGTTFDERFDSDWPLEWHMRNKVNLYHGQYSSKSLRSANTSKIFIKTVLGDFTKVINRFVRDRGATLSITKHEYFFMQDRILKIDFVHFYAWKKGLKTAMYYLRSSAALSRPIKITLDKSQLRATKSSSSPAEIANRKNRLLLPAH